MSRVGLVAAAGDSKRFGMAKALLVRSDGRSQVRAWAEELLSCCDKVVVTVPRDDAIAGLIAAELSGLQVLVCKNDHAAELWGSVQTALHHAPAQSLLLAPVDVPVVAGIAASLHLDDHDAACPKIDDHIGHPVLLSAAWLSRPEVAIAAQAGGIAQALQLPGVRCRHLITDDQRVLHNHNHPSAAPVVMTLLAGDAMLRASHGVRRRVFIEEQQVSEAEELDDHDSEARHWLAVQGDLVVGTARWLWLSRPAGEAKVQRVAVLAPWRRSGVGAQLMTAIEGDAQLHGARTLVLGAQLTAVSFYQRLGYVAVGEVFMDANIEHRTMTLRLGGRP